MACFLVGTAEAIAVTAAARAVKRREMKKQTVNFGGAAAADAIAERNTIPWSRKLMWLAYLLWGGALLLVFEHVWHGEAVPWYPFLTAMNTPGDAAEMLREMATVGVTMSGIVTAVWALVCAAADFIVKRAHRAGQEA